jgi:hypothetical protein
MEKVVNKIYNEWLSGYDCKENFGDSTSFAGCNDDIINGNFEISEYDGIKSYDVDEVCSIMIVGDDKVNDIINDYECCKVFKGDNVNYVVVW